MSRRVKSDDTIAPVPTSREEAEAMVRDFTHQLLLQKSIEAEMDMEIGRVKKRYERSLSKIEEELPPLRRAIEAWADANPTIFTGKKSLDMMHGTIGWRVNTPSLALAKGFKSWSAVLDRIKELGLTAYLRIKEEVNKEALLANRATEDLSRLYCRVNQDEQFFIEPKITETTK